MDGFCFVDLFCGEGSEVWLFLFFVLVYFGLVFVFCICVDL